MDGYLVVFFDRGAEGLLHAVELGIGAAKPDWRPQYDGRGKAIDLIGCDLKLGLVRRRIEDNRLRRPREVPSAVATQLVGNPDTQGGAVEFRRVEVGGQCD